MIDILMCWIAFVVFMIIFHIFFSIDKESEQVKKNFDETAKLYNDSFFEGLKKVADEKEAKEKEELKIAVKEVLEEKEPTIEINFDTGKITLPDNITAEEKAELEHVMKELQKFSPEELYTSLEDFLKEGGSSGGRIFPTFSDYTSAKTEGLANLQDEMEFHKEQTDHWSDLDFIEALYGFVNDGYDFDGLDELLSKAQEKQDLTKEERKKIREWYILASQDIIYDV